MTIQSTFLNLAHSCAQSISHGYAKFCYMYMAVLFADEMLQLRALKLNLCNVAGSEQKSLQRNPFNCQRYFQCSNNYWLEQLCPNNYYFDEHLQSCQPPSAKSKSHRLCEAGT